MTPSPDIPNDHPDNPRGGPELPRGGPVIPGHHSDGFAGDPGNASGAPGNRAGDAGIHDDADIDPGRRRFILRGAAGLTAFSLTHALAAANPLASANPLGNVSGDEDYEIVYKTVRIPRMPDELKGLRAVMISDIHAGPMDKATMDRYVARVNRLKPDIILIPGDFVHNRNEQAEPLCEALSKLESRHGTFGCTGNHDYIADADFVSKELEHAGVRMLRDAHTRIEVKGKELALIGLDDIREEEHFGPRFRAAVDGLDARLPNIVLCHKPYYLEEASEFGVGLMVSGHTHGGQIVAARIFGYPLSLALLFSKYVEGLYRVDRTQMYVTRGIGTTGIHVRVNCPPEITVLTLV
ncbi:MAG: metallophosphoesterase [Bacteroidota bacterium]|jgi:predicted MPP superfamily phosphohydrolase|nr:metallophosphoesterase [Bacteroidota bacterium]